MLAQIISTLDGLKLQSKVVFESMGDNKKIDRCALKKAHAKINSKVLQNEILKAYMQEHNIVSYVDIDVDSFSQYYNQKYSREKMQVLDNSNLSITLKILKEEEKSC
ncbi:MAG: hypothetical protein A3F91_09605 [Flavobacteria bacterium RIFCSPLOWO2_12_FULL_35_11]|nr:MAG: hypothetical protein A3F91_09605 [Flavobacteria bacterium RIFCSPLOWO2_12_FULL_35_11]